MKPKEVEAKLLSSIRTIEDLESVALEGVTEESFVTTDPDHGAIFAYMVQHATAHHGVLPTTEDLLVLHQFVSSSPGDLLSYARVVRRDEVARKARAVLYKGANLLETDMDAALAEIMKEVGDLRVSRGKRLTFIDRDGKDRLQTYDEVVQAAQENRVLGIRTGLRTFDIQQLGWREGELIIVLGSTGIGKSWLITKFGAVAYAEGKKVLIISPELSEQEQGYRFDAVLGHEWGFKLSNHELLTGNADRKEYARYIKRLEERSDLIVIDHSETGQSITFEDTWRYAMEHKPDMVLIDGLNLLGSAQPGLQGWEMLKTGSALLKSLAQQEGIVVIAAHQADRSGARSQSAPPGLHQIGYGYSVAQSADRVISLAMDRHNPLRRVYGVPKLRRGRQINFSRFLDFDVDIGNIEESEDQPEPEEETGDF